MISQSTSQTREKEACSKIENWWSRWTCYRREHEPADFLPPRVTLLFQNITCIPESRLPFDIIIALNEIVSDLDYRSYVVDPDGYLWSDICKNSDYKHKLIDCSHLYRYVDANSSLLSPRKHFYCDMCSRYMASQTHRYTCIHGCNFDVCGACYNRRNENPLRHFIKSSHL
jgi:hypothetical protein